MDLLAVSLAVALGGPLGAVAALPPAAVVAIADPVVHSTHESSAAKPPRSAAPGAYGSTTSHGNAAWRAPLEHLMVVRRFDAPAQRWLPGHRGVDLRARAGEAVLSPADGRVAFVGVVAGRPVVSLDHADPHLPGNVIRTTYEPLTSTLTVGHVVSAGEVIGTLASENHCPGGCLHWGAKRGQTYVDPLSLLRGPIRLLTPRQRGSRTG